MSSEGRSVELFQGTLDLIILRADRPDVAPVLDPYSAVVLQMDRSHIDTVLVAGEPVKCAGALLGSDSALLAEARSAARRLSAA